LKNGSFKEVSIIPPNMKEFAIVAGLCVALANAEDPVCGLTPYDPDKVIPVFLGVISSD